MSVFQSALVGPADLEKIHGLPKGSLTWCDKILPSELIPAQSAEFLDEVIESKSPALHALEQSLIHGVHEFGHLPTQDELDEWESLAAEKEWSEEVLLDQYLEEVLSKATA